MIFIATVSASFLDKALCEAFGFVFETTRDALPQDDKFVNDFRVR